MSDAKWQPRVEDDALIRGAGRYAADVPLPGQAIGYFVRSPHAAAKILKVDIEAAKRAPGVIGIVTPADMAAAGADNSAIVMPMVDRHGKTMPIPPRPPLAGDRVLHVGQPMLLVVADTLANAQDAAELVEIEYEELPAVTDVRAAIADGAPQLWPDAPNNTAIDWVGAEPDGAAKLAEVREILAKAHKIARVEVVNQRLCGVPMEPRGATASYDASSGRFTFRSSTQGVGSLRDTLAKAVGLDPKNLRVIAEDVGGAFGLKTPVYPEYPALLVASKMFDRPVHWMSSRGEAFMSDHHARDTVTTAELAIDADGRFLALHVHQLASMGAFLAGVGPQVAINNFSRCLPGMYDIPKAAVEVRCVFTNTTSTGPYRGAGRPEANYLLERLVEEAARVTGIDRVELRRKNLIPATAIPYKTPIGTVYDSGDFEPIFNRALELAEYPSFAARRADASRRGKLRGLGVSCFLEHSGAMPLEGASFVFREDNIMELRLNVHSTGQGHATVFPRVVADKLGIRPEEIVHRHGDSDYAIAGYASVGSRSAMAAGHAMARCIETVVAKGKAIAAKALESDEANIEYRNGAFEVSGTNRRIPLFDLARKARELAASGAIEETLDTTVKTETPQAFPNGCHIAEVEVDPATGKVAVARYTAVDDCGAVLDHTIVEAQVQGGFAQGLGQALLEHTVYDSDSGQLLTASLMDYALPRAEDVPDVVGDVHVVPATTNPWGTKGVGEAGTTAAIAAIMNAIADAIPGDAAKYMDMPATPEKVWRACRDGGVAGA